MGYLLYGYKKPSATSQVSPKVTVGSGAKGIALLPELIIIMIVLGLLSGCAQQGSRAPVEEARAIPSYRLQTHYVAPGETLYSIAWRYDLDYKNLAKINGLSSSYGIRPGQELALYKAPQGPAPSPPIKPSAANKPSPASPVKPPTPAPKAAPPAVKKRSPAASPSPPVSAVSNAVAWQWPLKGVLISGFQANGGLNRGIDIRGELRESVLAAASGEVVYSGSGLRGYGNLLIVKHNEQYLSAYAHNRVLLVAEGDRVKAGQKIAEVGSTGTNTPKLHFEIRRDGQPVDPLRYLPKL